MNTLSLTVSVILLGLLSYAVYKMISSTNTVASTPVESSVDLSTMSKSELLQYAKTNNIKVNSRSKKADIVEAIQTAKP